MKTARHAAVLALCRTESVQAWSNLVLDSFLEEDMPEREKAFASSLYFGVLSRLNTLDACINAHSSKKADKLDAHIRAILRLAIYQILYMNSVPDHAAVTEAVSLTKRVRKASASGFVNAVLRSFLRGEKQIPLPSSPLNERLAVEYSCDKALAAMLINTYGEDCAREILKNATEPAPVFIKVNTLKTTADELTALLEKRGISVQRDADFNDLLIANSQGALHKLKEFKQGLFHIQDKSSRLCAAELNAVSGDRILDVCAAPGGKSFTIAQAMQNKGELCCCDLYEKRLGLITKRAEELGITIINAMALDMSAPNPQLGLFDKILCDVPCSGYGTMRRKPEIKYKSPQNFASLPDLQYKILENSANYGKAGSRIIYSTCTLNPVENGAVVDKLLALGGFKEIKRHTVIPSDNSGDGFFYAILEKE